MESAFFKINVTTPSFPPIFPENVPPPSPAEVGGIEEISASLSEDDRVFLESEDEKEPLFRQAPPEPLLRRSLYWLLSLALNMIVLIFLAFIFFPPRPEPLLIDADFNELDGDQLDIMTLDEGNVNPTFAETYALTVPEVGEVSDFVVIDDPKKLFVDDMPAPFADQSRIEVTDLLSGRTDPGTKNDLLSKYGGTRKTKESVRLGLKWLKKQQLPDGSWSLSGPYRDGIGYDNPSAACGLALLAFEGDGNTRFSGDYKNVVKKGWKWLLTQQGEDGCFFQTGTSSSRFYTQAICSIALCELIAMEKKKGKGADLRTIAQRGIDYLVERQVQDRGGWRYDEGFDSDLSVTGWVLMALESARMADLYVPDETFERVSAFLDSVSEDGGAEYYYHPSERSTRPSMIATGLLCREYLGWDRKDPTLLRGAAKLVEEQNLIHYPDFNDPPENVSINTYGWYSASMMLKHLGPYHPYWRKWNDVMKVEIPGHQERKQSDEAGSWDPSADSYKFGGGRLYVTCLSILCLEVYYRHLSLYLNP